MSRLCSAQGCQRKHYCRGYCTAHYSRWKKGHDLSLPIKPRLRQPPERCTIGECDRKHYGRGYCHSHWWTHYKAKNLASVLHASAKYRAHKQGVIFTITLDDVERVITDTCPILGIKLNPMAKRSDHNSPSIDKIRPDLGYVPGNIQIVSWRANHLKNNATLEELKALGDWARSQE